MSVFVDYNFTINANAMAEGGVVVTTNNKNELLEQLPQPVFLVKDGTVIAANHSARIRDIAVGMPVSLLIAIGEAEYSEFKQGKLLLKCVLI